MTYKILRGNNRGDSRTGVKQVLYTRAYLKVKNKDESERCQENISQALIDLDEVAKECSIHSLKKRYDRTHEARSNTWMLQETGPGAETQPLQSQTGKYTHIHK